MVSLISWGIVWAIERFVGRCTKLVPILMIKANVGQHIKQPGFFCFLILSVLSLQGIGLNNINVFHRVDCIMKK